MNIPLTIQDYARQAYQWLLPTTPPGAAPRQEYAFGDPEPVLKDRLSDYLGVFQDSAWGFYLPPFSLEGLAKCERANPQHQAILRFKRNMVARWYKPSPLLPYAELRRAALDYLVFGTCYFRLEYNRMGGLLRLERRPALRMRRGVEPGVFFELRDFPERPLEYLPGEVVALMEDDVQQSVYGIPEYFGGLQSVLLSEDATLFRRKFFRNGSHLGYILVTTDAGLSVDTARAIEERISQSRGPGNFRSLYLNIPRSQSREPVKVIPVGDIATKDDFEKVKSVTREELLAMHRMQPGISGIIPDNLTGFGDLEKVMRVYCELEVPPLQQVFLGLNDLLPSGGRVAFDPPSWTHMQ